MDRNPADLSPNPGAIVPEHALSVASWLPGGNAALPDGLRHRKIAHGTIIAVVERGSYVVAREDGRRMVARAGEAFVAQDGEWLDILHRGDRRGGTMAACWVHLRVTLFGTLDACRLLDLPRVLDAGAGARMRDLIRSTPIVPGLAAAARRGEAALAALGLLATAGAPAPEGDALLARAAGLAPLADWVRARLGTRITVADLVHVAGGSRSRLHARFQRDLGLAPLAWVREMRLQAARDRLLATDEPVAAVGEACGFPDPFHFSRTVRARFGLAPRALRERGRLA